MRFSPGAEPRGSAHMRNERSGEQSRPAKQQDDPRGAVDPLQMTRFDGAEQRTQTEGQRQPPHQRTEPYPQDEDRRAGEGGVGTGEAEGRKNAEKSEDG